MLSLFKFKMLAKRTVVASPTFHKPQHVSVTPNMLHMVQNKHNFEAHSKGERPTAVKAMLWGSGLKSKWSYLKKFVKDEILTWPIPTETTVVWHLALSPDLTFWHLPSGVTDQLESCCLISWNTILSAKGLQEFFLKALQKAPRCWPHCSSVLKVVWWDGRCYSNRAGEAAAGLTVICQQNCLKTVSLRTRL